MEKLSFRSNGQELLFGASPPLLLYSVDANSLGTNRITSRGAGQNGAVTQEVTYNARTIPCTLGFVGLENGRYSERALRLLWRDISKILTPHAEGLLTYYTALDAYQIRCYPLEFPNYQRLAGASCKFSVDFVADMPFWQSAEENALALSPQTEIWTESDVETPVTLTIYGPAGNVKITNQTTGKFLRVGQSIGGGQRLEIETGRGQARLITGQAVTYANYKLAINSEYIKLAPGKNQILVESDSPNPVRLQYRNAYLGV